MLFSLAESPFALHRVTQHALSPSTLSNLVQGTLTRFVSSHDTALYPNPPHANTVSFVLAACGCCIINLSISSLRQQTYPCSTIVMIFFSLWPSCPLRSFVCLKHRLCYYLVQVLYLLRPYPIITIPRMICPESYKKGATRTVRPSVAPQLRKAINLTTDTCTCCCFVCVEPLPTFIPGDDFAAHSVVHTESTPLQHCIAKSAPAVALEQQTGLKCLCNSLHVFSQIWD